MSDPSKPNPLPSQGLPPTGDAPQQTPSEQAPPTSSGSPFAGIVPNRNSNIVFKSGPHANDSPTATGSASRLGHATVGEGESERPPVAVGGHGGRGGGFTDLHPNPLRCGHGDLAPAGSVPFGQDGGMLVGPNHPDVREGFARGGRGNGHDYGAEYGRYYPVVPGDDPRGRGRGRGGMAFGEPDPDNAVPFDPRGTGPGAFQNPRGRGGMPGNGLGGPGCY